MKPLLGLPVQKLFVIAVVLKVVSAALGWYLQLQWFLGFVLPLTVMAAYIALGIRRRDRDVTDEKFADSCYYLGFIFTITSIVFSLFDLPNIGERIQDIAVRFGAAMISTVFGLIVRVYLVSFRPDAGDALTDAEDAVLDAAQKFRERLLMAQEKLSDFQGQVEKATEQSVEAARLQVEKLALDHSARMERVFAELQERNRQSLSDTVTAVGAATGRIADVVDTYIAEMKSDLEVFGQSLEEFSNSIRRRLESTAFPEDFFAQRLAAPVSQLGAASNEIAQQAQEAATNVSEAGTVLSAAIRKLKAKATSTEEALETVVRLTGAQQALFDASGSQLEQLRHLSSVLIEAQQALQASTVVSVQTAGRIAELEGQLARLAGAVEASNLAITAELGKLSDALNAERAVTETLATHVETFGSGAGELVREVKANSMALSGLAQSISDDSNTKARLGAVLEAFRVRQDALAPMIEGSAGSIGLPQTAGALLPPEVDRDPTVPLIGPPVSDAPPVVGEAGAESSTVDGSSSSELVGAGSLGQPASRPTDGNVAV